MYKKALLTVFLGTNLMSTTIDFNEALNKTLQNNKSLKANKLSIDEAQSDLSNAKSYNYGTLKFKETVSKSNNAMNVFGMKLGSREADFGAFGFSQFDNSNPNILTVQPKDLNNPEARVNFETKLIYDLPLFAGFKLSEAKNMSKLQVLANTAKYTYDTKQLGLEVLKAYNGAVAAKQFILATKDAKTATTSFVNFATEMHNEGYVTKIDVQQAQVYDMGINSMLLESNNKYALAIAYLKFLTSDDTITNVDDFMDINIDTNNLKSLQDSYLLKREDYKWMKHNVNTMNKKISYEKSGHYPMLGLHLEYGFNDDKLTIDKEKDYYTAALGLEYTLFNGMKTSSEVKKAKITYAKTKYQLDYMKDAIKLDVEKSVLTLYTKKSVLKEKILAQNLALEVLEQSNEMYKNSLLKMSDLLMQQANAQKARANVIMARYELSLAGASLQLALGQDVHETGFIDEQINYENVVDTNISMDINTSIDLNISNDINTTKQIDTNKTIKTLDNNITQNLIQNIVNKHEILKYEVRKNNTQIRNAASSTAKVIKVLAQDHVVKIESCDKYAWCKLNGVEEYISLASIRKINDKGKK